MHFIQEHKQHPAKIISELELQFDSLPCLKPFIIPKSLQRKIPTSEDSLRMILELSIGPWHVLLCLGCPRALVTSVIEYLAVP